MLVSLLNLAFARAFGVRSTQALAVLNATFGVGAVLGPVPVAIALERGGGAAAGVGGFSSAFASLERGLNASAAAISARRAILAFTSTLLPPVWASEFSRTFALFR